MNQNHWVYVCVVIGNILFKLILNDKCPAADMYSGVVTSLNALDVETLDKEESWLVDSPLLLFKKTSWRFE